MEDAAYHIASEQRLAMGRKSADSNNDNSLDAGSEKGFDRGAEVKGQQASTQCADGSRREARLGVFFAFLLRCLDSDGSI
jgi:hypothetical protein